MKSLFSIFKKKKLNLVPKESELTKELKLKRNIVEHKKYADLNTKNKLNLKFAKDFIVDAQSKSIPITKLVIKGEYNSAANVYSKTTAEYKKYLLASGVSEKQLNSYMHTFKKVLFRNLF